jgi:transcriptional regulator with XRE-family HTH domain
VFQFNNFTPVNKMADRIRKIRVGKDLSQDFVAGKLKISQQKYQRIESGQTRLPADMLIDIAEALGCSVFDIIHTSHTEKNQAKVALEAAALESKYKNEFIDELRGAFQTSLETKDKMVALLEIQNAELKEEINALKKKQDNFKSTSTDLTAGVKKKKNLTAKSLHKH